MGQRHNSTSTLQIQKASFLPMLCSRPSIKNVTIPKSQDPSSLSLQEDDPLSPKISCIGQVKRNNKIINLPSTTTTTTINNTNYNKLAITTTKHHHHHHYFNLKRLFSGKSLAVSAAVTLAKPSNTTKTTTPTTTRRRRRGREELVKNGSNSKIDERFDDNNKGFVLNVVDLDPPLPVVKKKQDGGDKAPENLWKRRSGGLELRSLQIQQNKTHQMQLITTV